MDEDWFVRRDGSMFPVSYTSTALDMPEGPGVVVAFKDIEEQREAEQALREREAILATVGQPVWVTDASGRFHYANPAALAALGFSELLDLVGKPAHDTVHYKYPDWIPVPRGGLPARPGAQGGGDAAGRRGLARAQGRLDRARHLLLGALRAAPTGWAR
jgi:PAS domain-containing protein